MPAKPIIGIGGSPRSRLTLSILRDILDRCNDFDTLSDIIYKMGGDRKISNSDGILMASLYGAKEMGVAVDHVLLKDFFGKHQHPEEQIEILKQLIEDSAGLIFSSPVYFGDRSSLIADYILRIRNCGQLLPLENKAVGSVSVGAKRNGGQETTNVFALFDCLNLGASIVGNGPPTSQYGGTAVAGGMGAIIDDQFGLKTSRGTGQRVALLSRALSLEPSALSADKKIRLVFLVTCKDNHNYFINKIKELPFSENTRLDILDLTEMSLARCRACPVCPSGNLDKAYTCIIPPLSQNGRSDDMQYLHEYLVSADAVVLSHYHGSDSSIDQYQVFMERTRFIRRNQFELTNRVFSTFYESHYAPDIFTLRSLSSFLRHNLFLLGPFYNACGYDDKELIENIDTGLYIRRIEQLARKARAARELGYNTLETSYLPVGYPGV